MAFTNPLALTGFDLYTGILPWLFVFAICYGLLVKINIFDKVNKQVSIALSFVIASFAVAVGGGQIAYYFAALFGGFSMFAAGILVVILFLALASVGGKKHVDWFGESKWILGVVVLVGIVLFLSSSGNTLGIAIDSYWANIVFWLVILLAVIYFVTHESVGSDMM